MKLSTTAHHGTLMMVELAQNYGKGPLSIPDIARRYDLSPKYLEQIVIPLKKAKYVRGQRGFKGGHFLAKPPEKISVGEIMELLENTIDMTGCIADPSKCKKSNICEIRGVLSEANKALYDKLNSIKLSALTKGRGNI